jgi:CNT family concentrative nucleoside transporter
MALARAALGVLALCAIAWLCSEDRRGVRWRVVFGGLLLQLALAWFVLRTQAGVSLFESAGAFFAKLIGMTDHGVRMVFGELADPSGPWGFLFAFKALPAIIFFSALMSILYHLGIMQAVVWALAKVLSKTLGVSGAEAMSNAANIFCGQTEAPLVVKPYIPRMTRSELMAMMTGGFATIAGSVMAVYMGLVGTDLAPHLLSASVMAAPGAFVMAKLVRPERERSETAGEVRFEVRREAGSLIEAAANGTTDGLKLWLNVIAMLIAFVALIHLIDWPLGAIGQAFHVQDLSLTRLFAWGFAPVAWIVGVDGWHDCQVWGSLLGTKIAVNEFVAYTQMQGLLPGLSEAAFQSPRSAAMATYALCGFANFASIGIQIGGITPLAPERKREIVETAGKAMLAGALASCASAAIAGAFLG